MSLDKKGFAEIIVNAINECKNISNYSRNYLINLTVQNNEIDNVEYKYNKYMEKLALSKIERLYSLLSAPAYTRIMAMSDAEVDEYREEKVSEMTSSINRLMLAMEVSRNDDEKNSFKEKVETLVDEQTKLKEMTAEMLKEYVINNLGLDFKDESVSFDGKEETEILQNISKDKDTLSRFISMVNDYRTLEREIRSIRSEQIIIYNDLFNGNIKNELSIDKLFSEESLSNLQSAIAEKLNDILEAESNLKLDFSNKVKKAYCKIKSMDYKYDKDGKVSPYEEETLQIFEQIVPSRTTELAYLQNEEWMRLNKKVFKTTQVNESLAILSIEIDETKKLIESYVRDWYKNAYYNNSLFGPVSSRANGKFEYSLGAKNCLDEFINFGVWPDENAIMSLRACLKLNKIEAEKSIIHAEQIKERLVRLFNTSLEEKRKELELLDVKITCEFGNWKNEVILSIINESK